MHDPAIAIDGLGKSFGGYQAVKSLSLCVEGGEVFGFLGPNGAGKTTTIRMLMGVLVPTGGRARICGLDCQLDRVEVKRCVGYLPDQPSFYAYLRGRELLEFIGEMHGLSRAMAARRAMQLLYELALDGAGDEFAVNYSLGMKKKLGLACALMHDPQVLILDEPTSGLDPRAARSVEETLKAHAARGKTVFLSTHRMDMAERICTRVGIIHCGELVAVDTVSAVKDKVAVGASLEDVFIRLTDSVRLEEGAT